MVEYTLQEAVGALDPSIYIAPVSPDVFRKGLLFCVGHEVMFVIRCQNPAGEVIVYRAWGPTRAAPHEKGALIRDMVGSGPIVESPESPRSEDKGVTRDMVLDKCPLNQMGIRCPICGRYLGRLRILGVTEPVCPNCKRQLRIRMRCHGMAPDAELEVQVLRERIRVD